MLSRPPVSWRHSHSAYGLADRLLRLVSLSDTMAPLHGLIRLHPVRNPRKAPISPDAINRRGPSLLLHSR